MPLPSAKFEKGIREKEGRVAAITKAKANALARQEALRTQLGEAVANGTDATALQQDLRAVGDELDGFARALTHLERELTDLTAKRGNALAREAHAEFEPATDAAREAIAAIDARVRDFQAELAERIDDADDLVKAAVHAQQRAGDTSFTVNVTLWAEHPGLLQLGQALQDYTDGVVRYAPASASAAEASTSWRPHNPFA
jgi:chromosome segregation ATPase